LATPEREGIQTCQPDLAFRLDRLREEIGAIRRELSEASSGPAATDEDSYRLATEIDLLVTKFLRLSAREQERGEGGFPPLGGIDRPAEA